MVLFCLKFTILFSATTWITKCYFRKVGHQLNYFIRYESLNMTHFMNIYHLGFDSSKKTPAIIKARVIEMHKKHGSMLKEDAMLEYVKIVENIFPYRFIFMSYKYSLIHMKTDSFLFPTRRRERLPHITVDVNKTVFYQIYAWTVVLTKIF